MTYEYVLETDYGEIMLDIEVTHYSPYTPSNLTGHPDSWTPEEGGEIEYEVIKAEPIEKPEDAIYDFTETSTDSDEYINQLECYIRLMERCVDFEADCGSHEDDLIVEFLDKQIADERESAHFDRECERMGV